MTVRVMALTTVDEEQIEDLSTYIGITTPLLEAVGAKIVETYEVQETLVGAAMPQIVTIVDYPDMEAVRALFESYEYTSLKATRERAFKHYQVSIVAGPKHSYFDT